jgi:hypothetical protein
MDVSLTHRPQKESQQVAKDATLPAPAEAAQPTALGSESQQEKESYLLSRGWRRFGVGLSARWKDPRRPLIDTYSKPGEGRHPTRIDPRTGQEERIQAQNGFGKDKKVPVEQTIVTPAGRLLSLDEAVTQEQLYEYEAECAREQAFMDEEARKARVGR